MRPPFEAAMPCDRSGDPVTPEGGRTGLCQAERSEDTHTREFPKTIWTRTKETMAAEARLPRRGFIISQPQCLNSSRPH